MEWQGTNIEWVSGNTAVNRVYALLLTDLVTTAL